MGRLYKPGDAYTKSFTISDATGAASDADSTPTGTLYVNGAANGATVTITKPATGVYKAAATIPSNLTVGDTVELLIAATIDTVAAKAFVDAVRLVAFDSTDATDLGLSALTSGVMDSGTAQAGGASTVTLKSGTSITLDSNSVVMLTGGTGAGQTGRVSSYNGTTKVATMATAWNTAPDNTTTYDVLWAPLDKTGYALAATGLDAIPVTAPTGVASTFREMVVQLWRRRFKKVDKTSTSIRTYADNGTTVLTTQTISDTGGVATQGAAS
jgi:hypothetical protein